MEAGIVHCASDERRVDHSNATQDSGLSAPDGRLGGWRHGQLWVKSFMMAAASVTVAIPCR